MYLWLLLFYVLEGGASISYKETQKLKGSSGYHAVRLGAKQCYPPPKQLPTPREITKIKNFSWKHFCLFVLGLQGITLVRALLGISLK